VTLHYICGLERRRYSEPCKRARCPAVGWRREEYTRWTTVQRHRTHNAAVGGGAGLRPTGASWRREARLCHCTGGWMQLKQVRATTHARSANRSIHPSCQRSRRRLCSSCPACGSIACCFRLRVAPWTQRMDGRKTAVAACVYTWRSGPIAVAASDGRTAEWPARVWWGGAAFYTTKLLRPDHKSLLVAGFCSGRFRPRWRQASFYDRFLLLVSSGGVAMVFVIEIVHWHCDNALLWRIRTRTTYVCSYPFSCHQFLVNRTFVIYVLLYIFFYFRRSSTQSTIRILHYISHLVMAASLPWCSIHWRSKCICRRTTRWTDALENACRHPTRNVQRIRIQLKQLSKNAYQITWEFSLENYMDRSNSFHSKFAFLWPRCFWLCLLHGIL